MLATHEMPDTITLNVGGELFTTRLETLQLVPDSLQQGPERVDRASLQR